MSLIQSSVVYKPFKYPWAVDYAISHEKIHWGEWEAKLQEDVAQWKGGIITPTEKLHITSILRLFTQSDVAVGTNYIDQFLPQFKNNEIRAMLTSFVNREFVHQRAYALLNDTLGLAEEEYSSFLAYDELKSKIEFMQSADTSTIAGLGKALAQSACNEGMALFSAFVMLLNYQRCGKMKGMCEIVEWSIRDESMHVEGMTRLFREYLNENPQLVTDDFKRDIYQMFRDAVTLEDKVIDLAYKDVNEIEGLSAQAVKDYIRYIADRRLIQLGLKGNFNVKNNPIEWLDWIVNGDSLKNFFEGTVTDYNAAGMKGDWGW